MTSAAVTGARVADLRSSVGLEIFSSSSSSSSDFSCMSRLGKSIFLYKKNEKRRIHLKMQKNGHFAFLKKESGTFAHKVKIRGIARRAERITIRICERRLPSSSSKKIAEFKVSHSFEKIRLKENRKEGKSKKLAKFFLRRPPQ